MPSRRASLVCSTTLPPNFLHGQHVPNSQSFPMALPISPRSPQVVKTRLNPDGGSVRTGFMVVVKWGCLRLRRGLVLLRPALPSGPPGFP